MAMKPRNWSVGENQLIQPAGARRPLTDIERGIVFLYLQKSGEITLANASKTSKSGNRPSNSPPPERFAETVRNFLREQLKGTEAYNGISPARDKVFLIGISNKLFEGLFYTHDGNDIRPDLDITQMVRRVAGLGKIQPTKAEVITALLELDEHLSSQGNRISGELQYGDVKTASENLWIVPSLGIPMPTTATIVNKLGKESWFDVVEEVFGTDQSKARQRSKGIALEILKNDYLELTEKMRSELEDDEYIPTHGDLIRRHKDDPSQISAHQYQQRLRYLDLTLNDLRESVGINRRAHEDHEIRSQEIDWNRGGTLSEEEVKDVVADAYIQAWSYFTGHPINSFEQIQAMISNSQPPTQTQLRDLSIENTQKINRGEEWVYAPDAGMVNVTFGGLNGILAYIEQKYEVEINIDSAARLTALTNGATVKGLASDQVPKCVARQMVCANNSMGIS